jgi:hypothetical protein
MLAWQSACNVNRWGNAALVRQCQIGVVWAGACAGCWMQIGWQARRMCFHTHAPTCMHSRIFTAFIIGARPMRTEHGANCLRRVPMAAELRMCLLASLPHLQHHQPRKRYAALHALSCKPPLFTVCASCVPHNMLICQAPPTREVLRSWVPAVLQVRGSSMVAMHTVLHASCFCRLCFCQRPICASA